ncbi:hypothetical protein [Krasilnikovia sp. MM14-A1004]|uniref:hypothetical protein n=1 Tax=Krasilnikovia sp. MM14-A1004 TaxID=3373541 RepID=UPI00399D232B
MATLLSSHDLVLRPDHLILQLRDVDCDAGIGAEQAINQTHTSIVASSGYTVYVEAVQNLIAVRVDVEVWDSEPDSRPTTVDWTGPTLVDLDCPTGHLQVGDDMGHAISEILPPQGPGRYHVAFYHHGRDEALQLEQQLTSVLAAPDGGQRLDDMRPNLEGRERYLFRVW